MNSFIVLCFIACLVVAPSNAFPVAEDSTQQQEQQLSFAIADSDSPAVDIPNHPLVALVPLTLEDIEPNEQHADETSARSARGLGLLGGLGGLGGGLGMGFKGLGGGLGGLHGLGGGLHGLGGGLGGLGGLGFKPFFGKILG